MRITFNKPYVTGNEMAYMAEAIAAGHLSGDGRFSRQCHSWLETRLQCKKALLTHSCTAALEMAAILCGLEPGDEVIMPSFTFVSTANAVCLRGATPVFVDVRADTLNIDESLIEAAVTPRTKAIMVVHYAGVACAMDPIMAIAQRYGLMVIEDAAQAILSRYRGQYLGTFGQFGALSFHETKNLISGEGGALLVNDEAYGERSEIIREKGTNRSKFFRGQVDKYTWVDIGSSYLPSELIAAFLYAQLELAEPLTARRLEIWNRYHAAFEDMEGAGAFRRPIVPSDCEHNGHLYYLMMPDAAARAALISDLKEKSIYAPFHYVPLHSSPAGRRLGRAATQMTNTDHAGECLVRLPVWVGMDDKTDEVIEAVMTHCGVPAG